VLSVNHFTNAMPGYRLIAANSTYVPPEAAHLHNFVRKETDGGLNSLL